MRKKYTVEITYKGIVEIDAPKSNFATFVDEVMDELEAREVHSFGTDGCFYKSGQFERGDVKYKEVSE